MLPKATSPFTRKVLPLLLLLLLLVSLLTGCRRVSTLPSDTPVPEKNTEQPVNPPEKNQAPETPEPPPAEETAPPAEPDEKTTSPAEPPQDGPQADARLQAEAETLAKERMQSDIDLALWCVQEARDGGSAVSFPYEAGPSAYAGLDRAQRKLYDEMLPRIQSLTPFAYTAAEHGYGVLDNAFTAAAALCADHPECALYFDIDEVFDGDTTTALRSSYFLPSDPDAKNTDDTDTLKQELRVFDAECDLIVQSMPSDFSTYDKYRYLAAVISLRTSYDNDFTGGKKTSTAYGAIHGPVAICQGYSLAFEYLCRKADLWCRTVSGVSMGEAHAWNLVRLDSGTYHVDITWADSDFNATLDQGWHRYFMLTQEQILTDHEIDDGTIATGTPLHELI